MNNEIILQVRNLTKIYKKYRFVNTKKVVGVRNLNFEIYENEIFGLLGLNGSGKTTVIKLILGLLRPDEGKVYFFDKKLPNWKINKYIGYLPEMVNFNKNFSGYELLTFYSKITDSVDIQRLNDVIKFVKLDKDIHRKVSDYSKGMVQRLGVAQAIIHNPQLLIFDEPTSGLDPVGIKEIRDLILELKLQKKTIFFSSHLISELEKVCDRVGIIHKGEIVRIVNNNEWQKVPLEEIFISSIEKN